MRSNFIFFFAFSIAFFVACRRVYVLHGVHTITNATIIHISLSLCTTHRHIRFDCVFFSSLLRNFIFSLLTPDRRTYTHTHRDRQRESMRTHTLAGPCVIAVCVCVGIFESSKCGGLSMRRTHFVYIQIYLIFMAVLVCLCVHVVSE